ncbi:ABC transporter ATP-binding protein [Neisseriaceae bacterium TC5R-5]|nr:ABC transporter ATP-binding protein [Neisseriaceae bacterium TC5R-5]
MKLSVNHRCADYDSYRAARVKSLFNVDSGANFTLEVNLPIDDTDWQVGIIVGPSGSGKSSLGAQLGAFYAPAWPADQPIIEAIAADGSFDDVTAALSAVGLGNVPTWLRPFAKLSNGEQFRAMLARLVCEAPALAIVDEFSSVVDRQIARIGASAFAKAWRRTAGQVVLLSCHEDILDWVQPDWVLHTATGEFERGRLRCRPRIEVDVYQTNWQFWPQFEPHHYLKLPHMIAATCYVAVVDGHPVAHVAFSTRPGLVEARACRLVVLPEWQGAGVGMRFLNAVCEQWRLGNNRYQRPMPTLFHTSHPGLAAALRRDAKWTQVSGRLVFSSKLRKAPPQTLGKYGGHFRAVQGFRYLGEASCA